MNHKQMNDSNNQTLTSVHTTNFPNILDQLGISLVVSTYQAGKLVVLRSDAGKINTHFRAFNKPRGMAATRDKIALGTAYHIWDLRNVPVVAEKLEPAGKHDACYLPRNIHITGDIDIHEMAWAGEELWFVNTKFSCLCTLGHPNSFVPRWRPPFISAYDLMDRCHLNGLCLQDDRPKYVTALAETDTPAGWRQHKARDGVLIDVESHEVLLRGLSMPHSPRWYRQQLWLLESGNGSLAKVDLSNGKLHTVTSLPGFTRGLDFWGDLAFVGLSQVRERAVFTGLPITELTERICGVWAVHIETGETVAFLKFTAGVEEIFAVSVLPQTRFPEIVDRNEPLLRTSYVLPDEALAETVNMTAAPVEWEKLLLRGNAFYNQGKLKEAIACYRESLEWQADFGQARYNLGIALGDNEEYDEAIACLQEAIEKEPDNADAHNSLGFVYSQKRELEKAIGHYETAIRLNATFAKAHFNLGMTLLQMGDFPRGWAESEWRWQTEQFTPFKCPQPRWDGKDMLDRTLLVHTEQGAGDAMQFIRYIPLVARRCQRVILVCMPELTPLFATRSGIDEIKPPGEIGIEEFDAYVPLMSLPYLLETTADTIPATIPYLAVLASYFDKHPLPATDRLKVGIAWGGSPTHKNDRHRSCQLTDFLPILQTPGIDFYSLQKGDRASELKDLPPEIQIADLSEQLQDYGDTAAIISQLDLVVSVDTSVVHLAGALGKTVWTLLCFNSDWRWMVTGSESPWYPTMKLFRQSQADDWHSVFGQVRDALSKY